MKSHSLCLNDVVAGFGTASLAVLATDSPLGHAFALSLGFDLAFNQRQGVSIFNLARSKMGRVGGPTHSGMQPDGGFVGLDGPPKDEIGAPTSRTTPRVLVPILADDGPTHSLEDIQASARQLKAQDKTLSLVIIEGFELLWNGRDDDLEDADRMLEGFRALSNELHLTVLAVIPLSARSTSRRAAGPSATTQLAFHKADLALLFQGEEVYDWHATGQHVAEVTLVKPVRGSAQTCKLGFSENLRFSELPAAS